MVDIHFATLGYRRGKKERRRKIETTGKNIMAASATQSGHNNTGAVL